MQKIVVVILHYQNELMTNRCVKSCLDTMPEGCNILIVDNNSPDMYYREKKDNRITIIRNNDKHAVSGMNFGFLYALYDMNADFVVNADNDIIFLDNWCEPLLKVMNENKKIGIVGGKQWDVEKKFHRQVGMDLIGGHLFVNYPEENMSVSWIQGSCVMMRASMMRLIGVHDDRFKIICSDSDYCLHAHVRGWDVVFVADSNVIHIGGSSYTKVCDTWAEDNTALLRKWSGASGMNIIGGLPLDHKKKKYLRVSYKIIKEGKDDVGRV